MFLNKTLNELHNSHLGGANIVLKNADLIKKYFRIKFKHERESQAFKDKQKVDLTEIYESGLFYSCNERKVNEVFSIVSKLHADQSAKDQVNTMFRILIDSFTYSTAKVPYYQNEERLKIYWATKIKAKRDFTAFKDQQKIEQKRIRDELLDEGFIPQILSNAFTNIKLSLSNYKELGSNLEFFRGADAKQFSASLEFVMTEIFEEEVKHVK